MQKIEVKPDLLRWAIKRSGRKPEEIFAANKKLQLWLDGEDSPTYRQLEKFADSTYTGLGFFYMDAPPDEPVPISDFRAISDATPREANANLLDTIYFAQGAQEFYRNHVLEQGGGELRFVGSARVEDDPMAVARDIREAVGADQARRLARNDTAAYIRHLRENLENIGITVFIKAHAGNNNKRKLDPVVFRGFCLSDRFAPLVFVNGNDSKTAQLFTLMHEVAHIWLHETGLSNPGAIDVGRDRTREAKIEEWCNKVSAEVLMPFARVQVMLQRQADDYELTDAVCKEFLISPMAAWRQIQAVQPRAYERYWEVFNRLKEQSEAHRIELEKAKEKSQGGPSPSQLALSRLGNRFALAVVESAHAGDLFYSDLKNFLGFASDRSLKSLEQKLGVV